MKQVGVIILLIAAFVGGIAIQPTVLDTGFLTVITGNKPAGGVESGEKKPLYWVAPMDKNYRRDKPGQSPMGMDLVPVYEEDSQGGEEGNVSISPAVENNLGVRTSAVQRGPFDLPINTVGYVGFDEDQLTHVHSRVDGWIEVLNVTSAGDLVKKGDTLYELYSPSLVNAQEEFLAAQRSGNRMLAKASRSRLLSLGLTPSQINRLEKRRKVEQRIRVSAERSGFVKQLNVREGMFIKPSTEVMSIGTLETVWVIAEVFERQANWVKSGQKVEMTNEAIPGKTWDGTVDYLYPVLDSKTRTLQVRIRVENPDHVLKPNMFANLSLMAPVGDDTLSIPKEALIRGGRYNRVVLAQGDGKFKSVLVEAGIEAGKRVQIIKGLNEGDNVVTSAQFLIDSESNIDAEIARMEERQSTDGDEANMASDTVTATGKVNKVMDDMAMLSITHDPIDTWGWPTMKMDFPVAEGISLDGLSSGQNITFDLQKQGDWDYMITRIEGSQTTNSDSGSADSKSKTVVATGTIKELMTEMAMITVVHDPIEEWQWPMMSMSFTLAEPGKIPEISNGDRIKFQLHEMDDGDYQISEIKRLTPKKATSNKTQ
ncbi:efflux RND transporter periplasmic adaptor subunit [Alkalimarinus sediminis]|uniref:Efflux RND transporter periplasmic adaptor subunit n=1 Tax=Alkalimarinus sediminis TaxID=1632866 RepID=A0A9E8HMY5_9ALTE|nr:efflux RND transporter periplasmic adaptor subunit [Alkalimarinus sediminis]UZW76272.1 efflux RND transporter periplasmic adaptor subunit [Alkalimarinus sediminis]